MKFEGFIEIYKGLFYCEKDGTPWSNRVGGAKYLFLDYLKPLTNKRGGYYLVGKSKSWHRVVYEFFRGPIPENMTVDHINNIRDDNRIENLQLLSNKENSRKCKKYKNNVSGYVGVRLYTLSNKPSNKWIAQITINGKVIHLGLFGDPEEAYKVYLEAKMKYHGKHSVDPLKK